MPFTQSKCPQCNKVAEGAREFNINGRLIVSLKCGHIIEHAALNHSLPEQIVSLDGKTLYPFQCEGVRFVENSGGRALIADEMGLGKTVQAVGTCFLHPEMLPALCIVKASLKTQWQKEWMRWCGEDYFAQVINSPKDYALPGMKAYILSYDILRRFCDPKKKKKKQEEELFEFKFASDSIDYLFSKPKSELSYDAETDPNHPNYPAIPKDEKSPLLELIERLKIKTIILDECQQIKNPDSQRTVFVRAICKHVDHVIALSGTPIKNNAAEYFPVLNILKPELYPKFSIFLMKECDSYFNGYAYKTGGLRDPKKFLEKTKSFIIRRERKEVLPELPPIRRSYQFHEMGKEVEESYKQEFINFRDEFNKVPDSEMSFADSSNIMAFLSRMRHLTGLAKIDPCIDHVMEVMGSTEDRITIFVHHNDVAEILIDKLNEVFAELNIPHCARHAAGTPALETEKNFEKARVLVCSTLAGGEGLNLQNLCSRFVMLERQWNPTNEEQAEARFPRPEGIKVDSIDGVYMIAVGTVDEFFAEIVEQKREIVSKTMTGEAAPWNQSSLMKELAETLAMNGGRKWSI